MLSAFSKRLLINSPKKTPNSVKYSCLIRKRDYSNAVVFKASGNGFKCTLRPDQMLQCLKTENSIHGFMFKAAINIHDIGQRMKTIYIDAFIDDAVWKKGCRELFVTTDIKNRVTQTSIESRNRAFNSFNGIRVRVKTSEGISSHGDLSGYTPRNVLNNNLKAEISE